MFYMYYTNNENITIALIVRWALNGNIDKIYNASISEELAEETRMAASACLEFLWGYLDFDELVEWADKIPGLNYFPRPEIPPSLFHQIAIETCNVANQLYLLQKQSGTLSIDKELNLLSELGDWTSFLNRYKESQHLSYFAIDLGNDCWLVMNKDILAWQVEKELRQGKASSFTTFINGLMVMFSYEYFSEFKQLKPCLKKVCLEVIEALLRQHYRKPIRNPEKWTIAMLLAFECPSYFWEWKIFRIAETQPSALTDLELNEIAMVSELAIAEIKKRETEPPEEGN